MNTGSHENTNRVMNIQEVSDFLNISVSTIYYLAQRGKIKGAKFGKHWRFLEQEILDYLRGNGAHGH
ncbi:MAG: helix-turn-helix domain-containing protein [Candidatus Omnitrophica bacterium]|nr:helix-turn-helix domain-containing protein [Candidatus Omnitrophota bacterium]